MLDDDALQALWAIYDATAIRPEYLIPVLQLESSLDPAIQNRAGLPYYGIAQTSGAKLASLGTTPAAFLAMTAGEQIRLAVLPYFQNVTSRYGIIRSATRAEQANFEPATLATVRALSQVIEPKGTRAYTDNAAALDPLRHGAITLADIAAAMSRAAAAPAVRSAIARAYQLRTTAGAAKEPVYGEDFLSPVATIATLALVLALALRS
jgi:hypothetical protein